MKFTKEIVEKVFENLGKTPDSIMNLMTVKVLMLTQKTIGVIHYELQSVRAAVLNLQLALTIEERLIRMM